MERRWLEALDAGARVAANEDIRVGAELARDSPRASDTVDGEDNAPNSRQRPSPGRFAGRRREFGTGQGSESGTSGHGDGPFKAPRLGTSAAHSGVRV